MGRKITLSIPGPPQGKERPRFDPRSKRTYTPSNTVEAEHHIRGLFRKKYPDFKVFTGPVMVRITAVFRMPGNLTNAQRSAALAGELYYTGKPDKDNIEKLIYDALNGEAFVDDAQIQGGCIKRYGAPERVDISIEEIEIAVTNNSDRRREKKVAQPSFRFRDRK